LKEQEIKSHKNRPKDSFKVKVGKPKRKGGGEDDRHVRKTTKSKHQRAETGVSEQEKKRRNQILIASHPNKT